MVIYLRAKVFQIESSRRAVKRIRLELDSFQSNSTCSGPEDHWRSSSPVKGVPLTPQRSAPVIVSWVSFRICPNSNHHFVQADPGSPAAHGRDAASHWETFRR